MDIEHFYPQPIRTEYRMALRQLQLLSGPYKVLNPKFRGRSKVVKSDDPAALDDSDPSRGKYIGSRLGWWAKLPTDATFFRISETAIQIYRTKLSKIEGWESEDEIGHTSVWTVRLSLYVTSNFKQA